MQTRATAAAIILSAGLIASARLLVAGAYRALWDGLWFGDWAPSFMGVIVFLVLLHPNFSTMMLGVGAGFSLALLGIAGALSDNADFLYLASAPLLALGARILPRLTGQGPALALGGGLAVDSAFRIMSGGAGVFEHPWTSLAYGLLLAVGGYLVYASAKNLGEGGSSSRSTEGAVILVLLALELSLAYPNALLRMAGIHDYGPPLLALIAGAGALGLALGPSAPLDLRHLLPLASALIALGGLGWLAGGFLGLVGLGTLVGASAAIGGRPVVWGAVFVLFSVMAVGVYAYPYLGLWPLADRLELIVAGALALGWLASLPLKPPQKSTVVPEGGLALLLATALLALSPAAAPALAPGVGELETGVVVSYNIHQGYTADARYNPWEIVGVLARLGAGVVCLQEVDGGRLTSAYVDIPLLLRLAGYSVAYVPAIEGTYGVAVAYQGYIKGSEGLLLTSRGEQRAAVKALLDNGWVVANAHLGLEAGERAQQASELLGFALAPAKALVLCGDFNEEEGEALRILSTHYLLKKPPTPPGFTCCLGEDTRVVIDYVAVLREGGLVITGYQAVVVEGSDHLPVRAIVENLGQ